MGEEEEWRQLAAVDCPASRLTPPPFPSSLLPLLPPPPAPFDALTPLPPSTLSTLQASALADQLIDTLLEVKPSDGSNSNLKEGRDVAEACVAARTVLFKKDLAVVAAMLKLATIEGQLGQVRCQRPSVKETCSGTNFYETTHFCTYPLPHPPGLGPAACQQRSGSGARDPE